VSECLPHGNGAQLSVPSLGDGMVDVLGDAHAQGPLSSFRELIPCPGGAQEPSPGRKPWES
jgi:hypothetical protein